MAASSSSPSSSEKTFAPLPLRARGTLEILDIAIKVYKQYFWSLLAWSAIALVPGQLFNLAFFLLPLIVGASVCCISAAVRGQPLSFSQCGSFSKPRYRAMLGVQFLGFALVGLATFVVAAVFIFLGAGAFSALGNLPGAILAILYIALFLFYIVVISTATVWVNMGIIVVCMEEDIRSSRALGRTSRALGRAYSLLQGSWIKVSALTSLLGLGMLALLGILWGFGIAFVGLTQVRDVFEGTSGGESAVGGVIFLLATSVVIWVLSAPIFYVTLGLFYLDLRVRKEALDIEWNAHQTVQPQAPQETPSQFAGAQPQFAPMLQAAPIPSEVAAPQISGAVYAPIETAPIETAPMVSAPLTSTPAPTQSPTFQPAPTPAANPGATMRLPDDNRLTQSAPLQNAAPVAAPVSAATITCPQCGSSSAAGQSFCMNCGARLNTAS